MRVQTNSRSRLAWKSHCALSDSNGLSCALVKFKPAQIFLEIVAKSWNSRSRLAGNSHTLSATVIMQCAFTQFDPAQMFLESYQEFKFSLSFGLKLSYALGDCNRLHLAVRFRPIWNCSNVSWESSGVLSRLASASW